MLMAIGPLKQRPNLRINDVNDDDNDNDYADRQTLYTQVACRVTLIRFI